MTHRTNPPPPFTSTSFPDRYGNFLYAGSVITEPVRGLEYLPGVLSGIQAVQGSVPYLCETVDLPLDSPHMASLIALQRVSDLVYAELEKLTEVLAAKALMENNDWLDGDATTYFEFETLPGYDCKVRVGEKKAITLVTKLRA